MEDQKVYKLSYFSPSPEWTQEERLKLIALIASKLKTKISDMEKVKLKEVYDLQDRILLISIMPKGFLEKNREGLLENFQPDNKFRG